MAQVLFPLLLFLPTKGLSGLSESSDNGAELSGPSCLEPPPPHFHVLVHA